MKTSNPLYIEPKDKKPFLFVVPSNCKWVYRNAWSSDPKSHDGYVIKGEGMNFYIPQLLHVDLGLVNLREHHFNCRPFSINCPDGVIVEIEAIARVSVKNDDRSIINFILNSSDKNLEELVSSSLNAILNLVVKNSVIQLLSLSGSEKTVLDSKASEKISQYLQGDGGVDYGLKANVNILHIEPPPIIKDALIRKNTSEIRKRTAHSEASRTAELIKRTGSDPTVTTVLEILKNAIKK